MNSPKYDTVRSRFDILVNGGGAVTLQFQRNPFHPLKRTVMVPWNTVMVMGPVVMSATVETEVQEDLLRQQEPCQEHDYDVMKPIVYQTWRSGSQGACTENSAIMAETQVSEWREVKDIRNNKLPMWGCRQSHDGYLH